MRLRAIIKGMKKLFLSEEFFMPGILNIFRYSHIILL